MSGERHDRVEDDEEEEKERLNRKLIELLNELRVALPGVQVLFAFQLILPFQQRFADTSDLQRGVYAVALACSAIASACLIAPAAYHRYRFRRLEEETADEKAEMLVAQDRMAATGLLFLALAMIGSVFVTLDMLFDSLVAVVAVSGLALLFAWLWYALPISRRVRSSGR
jgi:hypothetical protein